MSHGTGYTEVLSSLSEAELAQEIRTQARNNLLAVISTGEFSRLSEERLMLGFLECERRNRLDLFIEALDFDLTKKKDS